MTRETPIRPAAARIERGRICLQAHDATEHARMGDLLQQTISPRALGNRHENREWCVDLAYDAVLADLFADYERLRTHARQQERQRIEREARRQQRRARRPMRLAGIALLLVIGLLLIGQGLRSLQRDAANPAPQPSATRVPARLVAVIDGDTIDVEIDGVRQRIRYLGMDTPERDEPLYDQATRRNRALLAEGTVYLERDQSDHDRYGRLLRWVFLADGTLVNARLVGEGWARVALFEPDTRYRATLEEAEAAAKAGGLGLWKIDP